ncbi:MAG: GNAT family N-acetyltransferase [Anaerolineae bacterium]|nr:GNAT family N-acetyltransferase [Anaerolineae bacterium]
MMAETPALESERLILRMPTFEDVPRIQEFVSDRAIAATTLNIPHPYPEDGAVAWVQRRYKLAESGDDHCFAMILKAENRLIGAVMIRINHEHAHAEMGYWLGKPYWGQGYMTEAVRRVVQFGFDDLRLQRVYANHLGMNPASGRVMQKAGMRYEGTFPKHILKWGVFVDLVHYGITREDYESQ